MMEIELARRMGVPHYYLGYWISGCSTMSYKTSFRPCELLDGDGVWRRADQQPPSADAGADAGSGF
jgi:arginine-tRNA-protein transferase